MRRSSSPSAGDTHCSNQAASDDPYRLAALIPTPARASRWAQAVAACLACITHRRDKQQLLRGIAGKPPLPYHWHECRDEYEEREWWDAHSEELTWQAVENGTLRTTTLDELIGERRIERLLDELRAARTPDERTHECLSIP